MFRNNENYAYFLRRYKKYIDPIVKTYAYCLMPNHFHLLVQVRDEGELWDAYEEKLRTGDLPKFRTLEGREGKFGTLEGRREAMSQYISKQFANFFSSYTQAYNKMYKRKGSLFIKNFNRLPITTQSQLQRTVIYIHQNPVQARLAIFPEDWKFSSYKELISHDSSWLMKKECIELFDDVENFVRVHEASNSHW
jgi:REP element-mobilizing transposase RayT